MAPTAEKEEDREQVVNRITRATLVARWAVVAFVMAVLLAGCRSDGTLSVGPQRETISGRLGGEMRGSVGCAWLEGADGLRTEVAYPNHWRLEFEPLTLLDDEGAVFARQGDVVTVSGTYGGVGDTACRSGPLFGADEVRRPAG